MEATYCASIGAEYMHIVDTKEKRWIQQRLEGARGQFNFTAEQKNTFLERLTAAEGLEKFLVINTLVQNVLVWKVVNLSFQW
jgi:2-oxoglutarate dehydrogenase E1 component